MMRLFLLEEVREVANSGSPSRVLLREDGPCEELFVRVEVERCGSSVDEELALDAPISDSRAPCLEGGGGGGAFVLAAVVTLLALSPGVGFTTETGTSLECCDDSVREELLLDRCSTDECRSWLCRRARGTGGGALFCLEFDRLNGSSTFSADGDVACRVFAGASMYGECEDGTGVGGSGLLVSDVFRDLVTGDGAASVAAKSSKGTICGCRGDTSLP